VPSGCLDEQWCLQRSSQSTPLASRALRPATLACFALAAYLWLHAGIRSPARLAGVILAAIVGYHVMMFLGLASLILIAVLPNHGNLTPSVAMAPAGAVGAALIAVVFLQVLPSERDQLGLEISCCAIAGGLVGFLWEFAGFAPVRWLAQLPVWNGAVAGVLGLVAHLRSRPAAASTTALRLLAGAGLAGVCALLAFGDALRAAAEPAPVMVESPYVAVAREARVKSLSEAPPSVDLPAIPSVPARDMFTRGIAGFACYPPNDDPLTPDTRQVDSIQLRAPARHRYHLQCYPEKEGPQAPSAVHVSIVQYPNDAWARYDLRNQDGYQGVIQDRRTVKRITKHGRPIFAGKTRTYWSSGDKVIDIGGSAPPEILDAFIEAYLTRYPNTLEPGFDLPNLPPR
jgi:hypothetical protein